ncbi:Serine protease family [Globisporangium polare]
MCMSSTPVTSPRKQPTMPKAQSLTLEGKAVIKYIETYPKSHTSRSPTYSDARILGLTLPGFGDSEVLDKKHYYKHVKPLGGAKLAREAIAKLCKHEETVFIVGHSYGGHTTINITALNMNDPKVKIKGIVLLASVGQRVSKNMWPISSAILSGLIRCRLPGLSHASRYLSRVAYTKMLKFPGNAPTSHYAAGMVRNVTTKYEVVKNHLEQIAHIPAFVAWAKNDKLLSNATSQRLGESCHPGPRFEFERGGHNIQKTQVDILAEAIVRWTGEVSRSQQLGRPVRRNPLASVMNGV